MQPHAARAQSEVKKTLTLADVRKLIRTTLFSNFGTHPLSYKNSSRIAVFSYSSKAKTDKIFGTIVSEIAVLLKSMVRECVDGSIAVFPIYSITLPSFYFLDRGHYIESALTVDDFGITSVKVTQFESSKELGSDDSLNEYISEIVHTPEIIRNIQHRDFRTFTLKSPVRESIVDGTVPLQIRMSMGEIIDHFPADVHEIKALRINGKRPFSVDVPAQIDIGSLPTFREFCRRKEIYWECV